MKRRILIAITTLTFVAANVLSVLADGVAVELNGELLKYSLLEPLIVNDRVMVPIRETADFLGVDTQWFEESSTMTFTKGDDVAVHTLNQNFIISNGTVKTFDTPSQSINDRTVVPVRMLAEALGADVEWDGENRKVIITSKEEALSENSPEPSNALPSDALTESPQTATTPATEATPAPAATTPAITAAIPEDTVIPSGNNIKISVLANNSTEKIRVTDTAMKLLTETSSFYSTGPNHVFSVTYAPTSETQSNLVVVLTPYTNAGVAGLPKTLNFTVAAVDGYGSSDSYSSSSSSSSSSFSSDSSSSSSSQTETVYINSLDLSASKISYGNSVTVTAVTTNGADSVRLKDSYGNTFSETSSYSTESDGRRKWTITFSPTNSGSYYFIAKDVDGIEVSNQFSLTVDNGYSSSTGGLYINNISVSSSNISFGERVTVTVNTMDGAEKVWITDPYGNTLYEAAYHSTSGDNRVWELDIHPSYSGSYEIYASDSYGAEVSDSTTIYVN